MRPEETRTCIACGKPVLGRADKKFCNDWCRNGYNNKEKTASSDMMKAINAILKKNRRILETLIPVHAETGKCPKKKMVEKGFNFQYHTHVYTTKKQTRYFFCYEYGYLPIDNDYYFILRRNEN
jgi:predicted nucleic acid-binding Zn ribbon protein